MAKTKKSEYAPKETEARPKRAVSKSNLSAKKQAEAKTTSKKVGDVPKNTTAGYSTSPSMQGSSNAAANAKPKEKPKRFLSAHVHFMNDMRSEIVKKVGSNNPAVVMTAAGAEWKALKDKSKWEKLAADDKERYDIECMEYNGVVFGKPCPF